MRAVIRFFGPLAALLIALGAALPARAAEDIPTLMAERLNAGALKQLEGELTQKLSATPGDDQIRFALGATQFIRTIEGFEQDMYRYGLETQSEIAREMPFLRVPVPHNPTPEPITYEKLRATYANAVTGFKAADATLAQMGKGEVKLPLNLATARLDLNGDGKLDEAETVWRVFDALRQASNPWNRPPALTEDQAKQFVIAFDRGDATWLRGYCNLLSFILDFQLGYDWRVTFDNSYHLLFPQTNLPGAAVVRESVTENSGYSIQAIADSIVMIHELHWPVAEPKRLETALQDLQSVIALSRESWGFILTETDDEAEWIPSPKQKNGVLGIPIGLETVSGWMQFLDHFDGILSGKLLVPHWRFAKGFNLRRMFTEPQTFDLVLLIQGRSILPYLEDGPVMTSEDWRRFERMIGGDFLTFAAWVN